VPALVLLASDPHLNEGELLTLVREGPPLPSSHSPNLEQLRSVAIGNILAGQKTPGFAACVWRESDLDLHVVVVGKDQQPQTVLKWTPRPRVRQTAEERVRQPARDDFPPDPRLRLTSGCDGGTLLAAGQRSVRWLGGDEEAKEDPFSWTNVNVALGWLQDLAPGQLKSGDCNLLCTWSTPQAFTEQVRAAHGSLQQRKREAIAMLVAAHRLTVEEAAVAARMGTEVKVEDRRKDRSMALPDVSAFK
jgi:hypothetical protein